MTLYIIIIVQGHSLRFHTQMIQNMWQDSSETGIWLFVGLVKKSKATFYRFFQLANLQKGFNRKDQSSVKGLGDGWKYNACSAHFVNNLAENSVDFEETNGQRSQRNHFQTQVDTSRNWDSQAHQLANVSNGNKMGGPFGRREEKRRFKKGEREDKDEQMTAYKGNMKITEGLRTRSMSKPARINGMCLQSSV